jgi:Ni,Fe-hydrogenase III large subunit
VKSLRLSLAESVPLAALPELDREDFQEELTATLAAGARVAALFALPADRLDPEAPEIAHQLIAVIANDDAGSLRVCATRVGERYPSLTPRFPQLHRFEREIFEQWGVLPEAHPWLKPVRFQPSLRGPVDTAQLPPIGETDFFHVGGAEVHEVAVGPVHAGIIEPGHFRFACHGEHVYHLEIALGYQHRGVERALRGGPDKRTRHLIETLAGDTTVGHATAYARVCEALAVAMVPPQAHALRALALELERIANHVGDLGTLAGDVAFLPTAAYCGRLRGDFLNMTAILCGNRFGRGLVVPGGVGYPLDPPRAAAILARIDECCPALDAALALLFESSSVGARFEGTGTLTPELCRAMGFVGLTARAVGLARDVRSDHPFPGDPLAEIDKVTAYGGDVAARARVRRGEIAASLAFVRRELARPSEGAARVDLPPLGPRRIAVALVEGWRGEICHVALTDADGRFAAYKVVDPSFHNWAALAHAMRDQEISDFPLCNKSFNLSYCGQDL